MRKLKYILINCLALFILFSCNNEEDNFDYLNSVKAPENVNALFQVTQDNTGLVTITPNAEGAVSYNVTLGDDTAEAVVVKQGGNAQHVYAEGSYMVKIEAIGITGLKSEVTKDLLVSFKAPENLVVTIENDAAISKQVNVTATADFGMFYEVYFGEPGNDEPVLANIGETAKYIYQNAGTYTIRIVAKSAAIETTEYTEEFLVTAILQPLASAKTQPNRLASDVKSIFSAVYDDVAGSNFFPDWGQGGCCGSSWAMFTLPSNGDEMLQYINLSYQGIDIGAPVDASAMETLHIDIWTAQDLSIDIYPLPNGVVPADERFVTRTLVPNQWNSFDIPLTEFTDQGLSIDNLKQFKFVGNPFSGGATVFIDNIYFFRPSAITSGVTPITFEAPFELSSFDGGAISMIANPDTTGNPSSMVAQMVKNDGQPWAGSKITLDAPFSFAGSTTITAKVWSPRAGLKLLMKFEDNVPWPGVSGSAEITATTTVANAWEELTFDHTGIDTAIDWYNMILIMDNGTKGDGTSNYTIYIDDISSSPVLDFEPKFELSSFDGGAISVIANPDTTGNPSSMVAQMVKNDGQPWAGSKITVPTPFSFANSSVFTVKVWSPRVGLKLLMKFEDNVPWPGVSGSAEITATTTVANGWEVLTFDHGGIDTAIDWNNMVLIMDNGTKGDGSSNYTIYLDDFTQN